MSTRRVQLSVDERLAQLEEWQRRLQGDNNVSPTDTRYLYGARGDVLIALGPNDPDPLSLPTLPASPGTAVLSVNPGAPHGAEWAFLSGITATPL